MNYPEVLECLSSSYEFQGMRLGINNTCSIIAGMSPGIRQIPYFQVAGSNGKGSTSHFISAILQAFKLKVGLFTSPHLRDIRERIIINGQWIPQDSFVNSYERVKKVADNLISKKIIDSPPTFFEYTFLIALDYFEREKVDVAVLEVGLGGRLDATSSVTPAITVITSISKEHTRILGTRLRDIAEEKAGIIKKEIPIISGCPAPSIASHVIKKIALERKAPFYYVTDQEDSLDIIDNDSFYRCSYRSEEQEFHYDIHLNGIHQGKNAATAIKAVQVFAQSHPELVPSPIPTETVSKGISSAFIPARIETLSLNPPVILDGSHNTESVHALVTFLEQRNKKDLTLIFGVLEDKNYKEMIRLLIPFAGKIILTRPLSPRAIPAIELKKVFERYNKSVSIIDNLEEAYNDARQSKNEILITGSFYLVGVMRDLILKTNPGIGGEL